MEIKLESLYGNPILLTQSPHGVQNGKAIDTGNKILYAPCDIEIKAANYHYKKRWHSVAKVYTEQDTWFDINILNSTSIIEAAHGKPYRTGKFTTGEAIGERVPYYSNTTGKRADHWHTAVKAKGIWDVPLSYIKRTNTIKLVGSPFNPKWGQWPTYPDKTITVNLPINNLDMATLPIDSNGQQILFKCETIHTGTLNIRALPTSNSADLGDVPVGTVFDCTEIADGEVVSGIKTWYKYQNGWVSGAWIKVLPLADQSEVNTLKVENASLKSKISNAQEALK